MCVISFGQVAKLGEKIGKWDSTYRRVRLCRIFEGGERLCSLKDIQGSWGKKGGGTLDILAGGG